MSIKLRQNVLKYKKNGTYKSIDVFGKNQPSEPTVTEKPLGKVVVFGDSLSAGYNVGVKWSDFLTNASEVRNHAVSGSTIGSGYATDSSVRSQSLENLLTTYSTDVSWADVVIISYGSNDFNACASNSTTYENVFLKAISCVRTIRSNNPNARIIYTYIGFQKLKGTDYRTFYGLNTMVNALYNVMELEGVEICNMTNGSIGIDEHMLSDGRHPDADGIEIIGKNLNRMLLNDCYFSPPKKIDLYLGDVTSLNPLRYNAVFVLRMLMCGCTVDALVFVSDGVLGVGCMGFYNQTLKIAQWVIQLSTSGTKLMRAAIDIREDGTCNYKNLDTV